MWHWHSGTELLAGYISRVYSRASFLSLTSLSFKLFIEKCVMSSSLKVDNCVYHMTYVIR
jgi:hypothetical protein